MQAVGMNFRAIRTITSNDVRAYNEGDLVHEDAVVGAGADGGWLKLGVDVEAVPGARLDLPAKNASQGMWAAYAAGLGHDLGEAEGMTRAELIAAYHPDSAE